MEILLTKITELTALVEHLTTRLSVVEQNQRELTKLISVKKKKRKKRVEKRVSQNLGDVKTENNFVDVKFHPSRAARLERNLADLAPSYKVYIDKWLAVPQNQSFFRQSKAHSYIFSKHWRHVRSSDLIDKFSRITLQSFFRAVKAVNRDVTAKDVEFVFPKKRLITVLENFHHILKASKKAGRG